MARLARLSIPGVAHYLLQRGHNGGLIVRDAVDTELLLQTLREAARASGLALQAYAVTGQELHVLATPDTDTGTSRAMQALGRRYAASFNRRHARTGGLWDGRFRSALVEAGDPLLLAMRRIDALGLPATGDPELTGAAREGWPQGADGARSSAPHRLGGRRDPCVIDPPEYWKLGNTPFERESRYRALLLEPLPSAAADALQSAVRGNWAVGSAAFLQGLGQATARPVAPRPRGRPRRPG